MIHCLKNIIIWLAQDKSFKHHLWYVPYHLEIVEKICIELCEKYPHADREVIFTMVWMHDYPKIISSVQSSEECLQTEWYDMLIKHWFSVTQAAQIVEYILMMDRKHDLWNESVPIEIKIVSSADGLSHMIWPFTLLWLYENPDGEIDDLLSWSMKKLVNDREKKIVLKEIKEQYRQKYEYLLELHGKFRKKFVS